MSRENSPSYKFRQNTPQERHAALNIFLCCTALAMPGERFRVRIASEDGGSSDRVVVEVGMEGFNIYNNHETRLLEKYPLHHISRWSMRGTSLVLFTKQPVGISGRHALSGGCPA